MREVPVRAAALERRLSEPGVAVVPYLTAGFPSLQEFAVTLGALAKAAPLVEIGIPFSDPMADGATIQESSRLALEGGATLTAILEVLESLSDLDCDLAVMSYLNPLLAHGLDALMPRLGAVGVAALVVPDLPLEESGELAHAAGESGIGLVQMVTPVTSKDRMTRLGSISQGFTYAVTMTGTTGGSLDGEASVGEYLDLVRSVSEAPVVAGFGVRSAGQVGRLAPHCDAVIVGSALVEVIASGGDPVAFLEELRG